MRPILICIQLLLSTYAWAQYFSDVEVVTRQLSSWKAESIQEYSRTYHFGFSEGECELRIFIDDTLVAAQRSCYTWREPSAGFIDTFYTFTNVRIVGARFYSEETNGEFMILRNNSELMAGLLLYEPWTYEFFEGGEFGSVLPDDNTVFLPGDYSEASTRILQASDLENFNLNQLGIMRNEIYARYGYRFRAGGKMDQHFNRQDWYRANYDTVEQWFTEFERRNIETIQLLEKEKGKNER